MEPVVSLLSLTAIVVAGIALRMVFGLRKEVQSLRNQLFRAFAQGKASQRSVPNQPRVIETTPTPRRLTHGDGRTEARPPVLDKSKPTRVTTPTREAAAAPTLTSDWEERIGAKLPIWIGAVALILAGVFMVRYFAQQGLLGPQTRMVLAGVFGVSLVGLGQWLRTRQEQIAQGLAAAGVGVLYATMVGSVNLHQLISVQAGFVGMLVVTAGAVFLSLQHGRMVAFLGLAGGFLMPAILGAESVSVVQLFGYLFLLQAALAILGRSRRWWVLSLVTMCCSFVWVAVWMVLWFNTGDATWLGLFLLGSIAVSVLSSCGTKDVWGELPIAQVTGLVAMGVGLPLAGWLLSAADFAVIHWLYLGVLSAGCMALAWLRSEYIRLAAFALAAPLCFLTMWGLQGEPPHPQFTWVCVGMGCLWAIGSYVLSFRSEQKAHWLAMSGAAAVGHFVICYWFANASVTIAPWWLVGTALSAAYFVASVPVGRRVSDERRMPLAITLTTAVAFAAFVVPVELERQWIAVAWALMVPGVAFLCRWLRVPDLRYVVGGLSGLVLIQLVNPAGAEYPIGDHWLFNWLLYGYGVPVLCLVMAARFLPTEQKRVVSWLDGTAAFLGLAMVTLMIRHGFHPGSITFREEPALLEFASYSVAFGAAGAGLYSLVRNRSHVWQEATVVSMFLGLFVALLGCSFFGNPLFEHESVGATPVWNLLLFAFALPAVLAGTGAYLVSCDGYPNAAKFWLGGGSLFLAWLCISLQVRQGFQGTFLDGSGWGNAEWYAYSVAWLLFAISLLAAGLMTKSAMLRWASLFVMLVSVAKVFLLDTRNLEDLWRVVSFLGLGVSLLGIAWIYQHFVFRRGTGSQSPIAG